MTVIEMTDVDLPICPECDKPLYPGEKWIITDPLLIGTEIGSEGINGDYIHERCANETHIQNVIDYRYQLSSVSTGSDPEL